MKIDDINIELLTPMMRQYVEIKKQNEDKIIFFRLGEFYEMFFEDAIVSSHALEIALTGKRAGLEERVPMCGVPAHSYTSYLEKLVDAGHKVAIVEQLEEPGNSKLVRRGIVQVVTPGTIIKEDVSTTHIASYDLEHQIICFANISTGELFAKKLSSKLEHELAKYEIREVVSTKRVELPHYYVVSVIDDFSEYSSLYNNSIGIYHNSINMLLTYVEELYSSNLVHFKPVEIIVDDHRMKLDLNAIETLELVRSSRTKQKFGSLYWYLDQTSTAMGSRMLKHWIVNPLVNIDSIKSRQDIIETLVKNFIDLNELQTLLKEVYDLERICAKVSVGSANARDLLWLKNSLQVIPSINSLLKKLGIDYYVEELDGIVELLDKSISEDAPISVKDGNIIKYSYNSELDELKDISNNGKKWLIDLEIREKKRTGIKNLKVKYNKVFGYFIEISNSYLHLVKDEFGYERKQTLTSGERFISAELKEKEDMILNVSERLINLEYDLFVDIRSFIKNNISSIQKNAVILSNIDCLCSLACVADKENLTRPTFNDEFIIDIKGCRHPVVEKASNTLFVENDIKFNAIQNVMIITGPNMSGKSTYMRQMALSAIMSQIGSFVSCESSNTMIFDAIFTRIGASDDLSSGQSTFMLEMLEANYAIQNATKNSLILFDELGRGTSTYDGMSISHSIIEYISKQVEAKTLFSTHYHELTSLANEKIFNVHASVIEEGKNVIFKHKIEEGPASKSYGIYVASLAGLPLTIIDSSYKVLDHYENLDSNTKDIKVEYVEVESKVEQKIRSLDVNTISPINALNLLHEFKNELD